MAEHDWRILIVDDDEDIHRITGLALRRKSFRGRTFGVESAYSAQQAREILARPGSGFHVALVDVVMETKHAGLDLCRQIRSEYPPSLRIVLRTGQPGEAPEEQILSDYDIDHYLAKADVTSERLFATIRSCLRSSQDVETLLAFGRQLRSFTTALQSATSSDDLDLFLAEGLRFVEIKHGARIRFIKDANAETTEEAALVRVAHDTSPKNVLRRVSTNDAKAVLAFDVAVEGTEHIVHAGFVADLDRNVIIEALAADILLFVENWRIAYGTLLLQHRVAREKMLKEQMYLERLQSVANMVTGVAHEINTPLGVANTANSMIASLCKEITSAKSSLPEDLVGDLVEASSLLDRNLARAARLVKSFKQLSANQLSDEYASTDLRDIVRECVDTMAPEIRKHKLQVTVDAPDPAPWDGYPGHLSQVLINFFQNAIRYAYGQSASGGPIAIGIHEAEGRGYTLTFGDRGAGVPAEVLPRLFEPFVTSGRDKGGTGLGLAICRNIVTNLLKGDLSCQTAVGEGTTFTVAVPRKVPRTPHGQAGDPSGEMRQ